MANVKPEYDVINIFPTFVVGKNELATTKEAVMSPFGSNALVMGPVLGVKNPDGLVYTTVHVDDVAFLHIAALDPKIQGNQSFGANCNGIEGVRYDDAIDIVKKHFPQEVKDGVFPLGGSQPPLPLRFDAARSEDLFDFKFKTFEEQVVSVAGWYAEVAARA